jgi:hypothetical protein
VWRGAQPWSQVLAGVSVSVHYVSCRQGEERANHGAAEQCMQRSVHSALLHSHPLMLVVMRLATKYGFSKVNMLSSR